jgi:predicted transcriptional regulator
MRNWSFITNHGLVLAAIARRPRSTCREIGDAVGITERAAHGIVRDLEEAGYITKAKAGRQNVYEVYPDMPLGEQAVDAVIGELLLVLGWKPKRREAKARIAQSHTQQC